MYEIYKYKWNIFKIFESTKNGNRKYWSEGLH